MKIARGSVTLHGRFFRLLSMFDSSKVYNLMELQGERDREAPPYPDGFAQLQSQFRAGLLV